MSIRTFLGQFDSVRWSYAAGAYLLTGQVTAYGRTDRPVALEVTRERLQSMVVNLTAEGGLFPADLADTVSQVRRLQLLTHLGVPEAMARELTGTADDGPVTLAIEQRLAEHLTRATDSSAQA